MHRGGRLIGKLISSTLLVQSWIPDSEFYWALNGVTWFLSSLIFCYAMSSLTIRWLKKVDNGFVGVFFILMAEFVVEAFAIRFLSQNMCTWLTYICPAFRFLDYSLGMCLFKVHQEFIRNDHSGQKSNNIIPATILLYLLLAFVGENVIDFYTVYHVFEVALFMFIVCFPCKSRRLVFENKFMVCVGNMSMEIFLTHKIVLSYLSIIWEKVIGTEYPVLEWTLILTIIAFVGFCTKYVLDRIKRGSRAAQS